MQFDWSSLRDELREDSDGDAGMLSLMAKAIMTRPRRKVILYVRVQEWLHNRGHETAARWVSARIVTHYGCFIPPTAKIGRGVLFAHPTGVVVGENAVIGPNCTIFQNVTLGLSYQSVTLGESSLGAGGYPILGAGVTLFSGAQILGDVRLAANVSVGAMAVVTKDCMVPGATLVGAPARLLPKKENH